jgi:hypothetical protein
MMKKKNSFEIYDVASTLFLCGIFLSFGETCFQKIIFSQIFLVFKKKKAEAEIYTYTITMLNLHIVQTWIAII